MGLASAPSAEQNCMPVSSAPTLPRASGLSAARMSRNASPTSALAMTARSLLCVPQWSGKRRRHQGALTTRAAPSTISSRNSRSDREARQGKPLPSDHAPLIIEFDSPSTPFGADWASAESRIAARSRSSDKPQGQCVGLFLILD